MPTLANDQDFHQLLGRIQRLESGSRALWGRMNVAEMLAHLCAAVYVSLGRKEANPIGNALTQTLISTLMVDKMPWPKNLPTAPEFVVPAQPGEFLAYKAQLLVALDEFRAADPKGRFGMHPLFGKLSGARHAQVLYKHIDHHLRQFGV